MALGNNLKRIKKDSLIPPKKEKIAKSKPKKIAIAKPKQVVQKKASTKPKTSKNKIGVKKKTKANSVSKPVVSTATETVNLNEQILVGGENDSVITIKLIPSRRKTVRKTKLIFEGSLSLLEAETIKNGLMTTFNDYDIIDIQLINITHLDIIPVQLFKIFSNYYTDKKVKIDSDIPFDMKIVIERAGFGSFMFKEEAA